MRADRRGLVAGTGPRVNTFALMVNEVFARCRVSASGAMFAEPLEKPLFFNDLAVQRRKSEVAVRPITPPFPQNIKFEANECQKRGFFPTEF